ncbi:VOC family protein [Kribbella shirazensis]|uniref:Catechol 2,3-dioxygenase-like lactoylglutathione lyase family enzyme n=1 Tax=Kribbella shirazensis TaxID=1105143 RepID=A0A7X6A4E5_9ACTN|nr:catechol 2,3-dioxygenase-like lactoylglutathione lyase family enzyme [Kribbella shirazensis]
MAFRLEVVTLPVADVDRSKAFYQSLGWRLDNDRAVDGDFRTVQFTPPRSRASIQFGIGLTSAEPGSAARLMLVVDDIDAARTDLVNRGVEVSDVYHYERSPGRSGEIASRVPGRDPAERSYFTYASFADPDGNGWLLQEVKTRLPGREWKSSHDSDPMVPTTEVRREIARQHDAFEQVAAPQAWLDWYGRYLQERERGSTPDQASLAAYRYMTDEVNGTSSPTGQRGRKLGHGGQPGNCG